MHTHTFIFRLKEGKRRRGNRCSSRARQSKKSGRRNNRANQVQERGRARRVGGGTTEPIKFKSEAEQESRQSKCKSSPAPNLSLSTLTLIFNPQTALLFRSSCELSWFFLCDHVMHIHTFIFRLKEGKRKGRENRCSSRARQSKKSGKRNNRANQVQEQGRARRA